VGEGHDCGDNQPEDAGPVTPRPIATGARTRPLVLLRGLFATLWGLQIIHGNNRIKSINMNAHQPLHQIGSQEEAASGGCGCNEHDADIPTLDATVIPHAIRHATIFGALATLHPGFSLDLLAPHDPLPLLAQIKEAYQETMTWSYVETGPEVWRLRFTRS